MSPEIRITLLRSMFPFQRMDEPPEITALTEEAENLSREIKDLKMYIRGIPHGFIPKENQSAARWKARKQINEKVRRLDAIRIVALKAGWIRPPPVESDHGGE